jgi:hypothetical protein
MFKNAISKIAIISSISLASFYAGKRSVLYPDRLENDDFCVSDKFTDKVGFMTGISILRH